MEEPSCQRRNMSGLSFEMELEKHCRLCTLLKYITFLFLRKLIVLENVFRLEKKEEKDESGLERQRRWKE